MMSTAPPLLLTHEQASRLQAYLQIYRRMTFASLLPSIERNQTLRLLQGMQGKLIGIVDQKTASLQLILTIEEMTTLKIIIRELLTLYATQPGGPERNATLADLADLKGRLRNY